MPKEQLYALTHNKRVSVHDTTLMHSSQMPSEGELKTHKEIIHAWFACGNSFTLDQAKYPVRRLSTLSVDGHTLRWAGMPVATIEYNGVVIHAFINQALYAIVRIIEMHLTDAKFMRVDQLPTVDGAKKTRGTSSKRKYNPTDTYEAPSQIIRVDSAGHVQIDESTELESALGTILGEAQPDEYLADDDPFVTGLAEFAGK